MGDKMGNGFVLIQLLNNNRIFDYEYNQRISEKTLQFS